MKQQRMHQGSLPTGPASWVPSTSQSMDNFQSNQMNYHIPSSGSPMVVVDPQAIVPKEKKKKSKKRNAQWLVDSEAIAPKKIKKEIEEAYQSEGKRVDEQYLSGHQMLHPRTYFQADRPSGRYEG